MSNVIVAKDLLDLQSNEKIFIADCRFELSDPGLGRKQYMDGHIPGATYLSLDDDLSAPITEHGGRHPLPTVERIADLFGTLGIERSRTRVVAYDDSGSPFAARLWWMLRFLGHNNVQVLDGGWSAYLDAGGEVTSEIPETNPVTFIPDVQHKMRVDMNDVRNKIDRSGLVDCRSSERYRGENETIDPKGGHIPGAKNLSWRENLTDTNVFLPAESLRQRYGTLPPQPVMYCGSGVTACVNILAMEHAGIPGAKLYPGSWSDWISYGENDIE